MNEQVIKQLNKWGIRTSIGILGTSSKCIFIWVNESLSKSASELVRDKHNYRGATCTTKTKPKQIHYYLSKWVSKWVSQWMSEGLGQL